MEKLELKHLAPYLPYGLKVLNTANYKQTGMANICQLSALICNNSMCVKELGAKQVIKHHSPILRPFRDLKNYITVDGDEFCPMFLLDQQYATLDFVSQAESLILDDRWNVCCDYGLIQLLFEWHFDVFGLIKKELAIDINTIK